MTSEGSFLPLIIFTLLFWYMTGGLFIWDRQGPDSEDIIEGLAYWLLTPLVALIWFAEILRQTPKFLYKLILALIATIGEIQ